MSEKEKELQEEPEAEVGSEGEAGTGAPEKVEEAVADSEPTDEAAQAAEEAVEESGQTDEAAQAAEEAVEESGQTDEAAQAAEEAVEESGQTDEAAQTAERAEEGEEATEEEVEKAEAAGEAPAGEETGEPEAPEDTGPPKRWFVVHTYSGHENKVKDNIQKMINASGIQDHFGQIIVPTEEVTEMKKGKKTVTTRKFFPSYILVEMHMTDESRHLVSDIPGVTSFVGTASGPQPLSKAEVERILGRMDKEKQTIIPEIPFALGEHIRIKDGPFSDFTGIVDEINAERGKLKVLVSIFGRETPVELDFLQVENL
jgi:transcriptional antiterminator NusG